MDKLALGELRPTISRHSNGALKELLKVNKAAASIQVHMRIPGRWSHPRELIQRLPADCRFTRAALVLPDGKQVEFDAMEPDDQFPRIFRSACRRPAADAELATVDGYTVNALLSGPGGSMEAARTMMQAGAALVRAGGAGVFIDNARWPTADRPGSK